MGWVTVWEEERVARHRSMMKTSAVYIALLGMALLFSLWRYLSANVFASYDFCFPNLSINVPWMVFQIT